MISICIPTKNEEINLSKCLDSLDAQFDDVVIVDSGSKDSTCAIAAKYGAKVIHFNWDGKFPKKRNWMLRNYNFQYPWVLFLDADERLTASVIKEIQTSIPNSSYVGYWLTFTNWFMGRPLRYGDRFRKLALFRIDAGEYEVYPEHDWSVLDMEVHEHPVLEGEVGSIVSRLEHYDYRGLKHYIAKHNEYSSWEAQRYIWLQSASDEEWLRLNKRQRFKYRHLRKRWLSWFYYFICICIKQGWRDGREGWMLARMKKRYFDEIRLKILESECGQ